MEEDELAPVLSLEELLPPKRPPNQPPEPSPLPVLSLLPVIIVFIAFQKYIVEGIATDGIKG